MFRGGFRGLTENSVNSARWQRLTAFSVPLLPTAHVSAGLSAESRWICFSCSHCAGGNNVTHLGHTIPIAAGKACEMKEKKKSGSVLRWVCTVLTVIMALVWLSPLYWITATALKSESDTIALPPSLVPYPPDFGAFTFVIQNSPISRWYFNTILVSALITVFSIVCALMCAYALSLLEFRGKKLVYLALLYARS